MRLYFKITNRSDGSVWYASGMMTKSTPEKHCAFIQKSADKRGIGCDYELATRAEYDAHFAALKAAKAGV